MNKQSISIPYMSLSMPMIYGHYARVGPGWSYHDHHHSPFEWLYCVEGEVIEWVKDEPYHLQQGDWLLLKPGVRHSTLNRSSTELAYITIHFELDDPELRRRLWDIQLIHMTTHHPEYAKFQDAINYIENWVRLLGTEPTLEQKLELMIWIAKFTLELLALPDPQPQAHEYSSHEAELAHRVARLLEAHRSDILQIQQLAKQFHLSRNHLSRVFAKVYGMSPRQYLSKLQMRKAKELIIHTPMTIEAIAIELGFASLSHFSRQFKRWTGVNPQQFRPYRLGNITIGQKVR